MTEVPTHSADRATAPSAPRATTWRLRPLIIGLVGVRLLLTSAGCDTPDHCDLGAAACVDNTAMNCGQADDRAAEWERQDCGVGVCVVTDGNDPMAMCTDTNEPDATCSDYSPNQIIEHQRCDQNRVIDCLGAYRQAEIVCAESQQCEQWEEETASGSIAHAACAETSPAP